MCQKCCFGANIEVIQILEAKINKLIIKLMQ